MREGLLNLRVMKPFRYRAERHLQQKENKRKSLTKVRLFQEREKFGLKNVCLVWVGSHTSNV